VLKEGDKAPSFNLESDEGGRVSLRDFADKTLVLYFYPRDNTPGCTRQAQAFTAARRAIEAEGGAVVGVSRDSLKSHASFREKCKLGIMLLSDPDLATHKAYGAWGEKTMYGKKIEGVLRTTFVLKGGKVARVFPNVKVDGHADVVLAAIGGGGASKKPAPTKAAPAPKKATAAPKKAAAAPTKAAPKKKGSAKK
jgi:thioredoxin-dependent peroxiredoxin